MVAKIRRFRLIWALMVAVAIACSLNAAFWVYRFIIAQRSAAIASARTLRADAGNASTQSKYVPMRPQKIVGASGVLSRQEERDFGAGTSVARKYIKAWVSKDYRDAYRLESRKNISYSREYEVYRRRTALWRERGARHDVGAIPSAGELSSSLRLILHVTGPQAQVLLVLAVDGEKTLYALNADKWPDKCMFLAHKMNGGVYILMLVRADGAWSLMNAPGTLPLPASLSPKHDPNDVHRRRPFQPGTRTRQG